MKASARNRSRKQGRVVALALTWDGARWPVRSLSPKARAFLREGTAPSAKSLTRLLADDQVKELRICWVPALKGGDDVLAEPFATATGKRIALPVAKLERLGDVLGVIYRRENARPLDKGQGAFD